MSGLVNANSYRLPFADGVFHCAVTSIPYWGLRTYLDNAPQVWRGDPGCCHEFVGRRYYTEQSAAVASGEAWSVPGEANAEHLKAARWREDATCSKCSAWLGSYGLEPTLDSYVEHTVLVFREVWRVLRPEATLWLNVGDSFATSPNGWSAKQTKAAGRDDRTFRDKPFSTVGHGLKAKDLCMVPARVALALQADGWWVRRDIIWSKPNSMPESARDRPTTSHEYIYLLTKREHYYYDGEAVKEKTNGTAHPRGNGVNPKAAAKPTSWDTGPGAHKQKVGHYSRQNESFAAAATEVLPTRAMRSVWTLPTQHYSGAHFATFPDELPERAIRAGTSHHGCCPICGQPWVRVLLRAPVGDLRRDRRRFDGVEGKSVYPSMPADRQLPETLGWRSTCRCEGGREAVPCRVLDPFVGSGTTVAAARRLGRQGYGVDLSLVYLRHNALPRAAGLTVADSVAELPLFAGNGHRGGGGG